MKMFIHSSFGVLECQPMTLQAIENSISEAELKESIQDFELSAETEAIDTLVDSDEEN